MAKSLLVEPLRKLEADSSTISSMNIVVALNSIVNNIKEQSNVVEGIAWRQYTPYFNDGDECVFSIRGAYLLIPSQATEETNWWHLRVGDTVYQMVDEYDLSEYDLGNLKGVVQDIEDTLDNMGDKLKEMFGDHCEVICINEKIFVQEYAHD